MGDHQEAESNHAAPFYKFHIVILLDLKNNFEEITPLKQYTTISVPILVRFFLIQLYIVNSQYFIR